MSRLIGFLWLLGCTDAPRGDHLPEGFGWDDIAYAVEAQGFSNPRLDGAIPPPGWNTCPPPALTYDLLVDFAGATFPATACVTMATRAVTVSLKVP